MDNYICINGKKAKLTTEQLKALGIVIEKPNPFARELHTGQVIYCISECGELGVNYNANSTHSDMIYAVANYCTDRDLMQQRAYSETLSRLLWRYSMENNGDKIDWSKSTQRKYYILRDRNNFIVTWGYGCRDIFNAYFISQGVAEAAIKEIIKPFMEAHPDFEI
jgi:hypothetical protein